MSVTDRPTKSHEYLFLLTKSERYYYDAEAIKEPAADYDRKGGSAPWTADSGHTNGMGSRTFHQMAGASGRNRRSVWTIATEPYPEAHFATFPEALVEPCILAGTSERGACPTCGAGWTRVVERRVPQDPGRGDASKLRDATGLSALAASTAQRRLGQAYQDQLDAQPDQDQLDAQPVKTVGWTPDCACPANEPIRCRVLDPFAGSGTTVLAATRLGRVGIGVELKGEYLGLARTRTGQMRLAW